MCTGHLFLILDCDGVVFETIVQLSYMVGLLDIVYAIVIYSRSFCVFRVICNLSSFHVSIALSYRRIGGRA